MAEAWGSHVSRETYDRLKVYEALLRRWQGSINLVANGTLSAIWARHFADSLQLRRLAPEVKSWIDLGSGAGFPGLVIAIDLVGVSGAAVHLIEANAKKCAFLREVSRETGAPAIIHNQRVETILPTLGHDAPTVICARAMAPLTHLVSLTHQMLTTSTRALFLKGQDVEAELTESSKCWILEFVLHRSSVDERGCVVEVTGAKPRF